ncbi:MAG: hypothetical protein JWM10_2698 [Myxococcaceae bacterium]|nr:hypothetical protein [Myxococcaceae bacterium]
MIRHLRRLTLAVAALAALLVAPAARADEVSWLASPVVWEATRRAALRAGLDDAPVRSLARRARAAAWLPTVSLHATRGLGANSTLVTSANDRLAIAESLSFDVRLSFDLDRLLFDGHEVTLLRLAAQRAEQRMALERAVIELLARREALRLRPVDPDAPPDVAVLVERARLEASLELLTGLSAVELLAAAVPTSAPARR